MMRKVTGRSAAMRDTETRYSRFDKAPRLRIVRRVRGMRTIAVTTDIADVVTTMIAVLALSGGVALGLLLWTSDGTAFARWLDHGAPAEWRALVQLASWITLGVAVGAFLLIRRGLRDNAARTRIGILWDVTAFWPRSFHPFAPPTYASRAVPELQARLAEITTTCSADADVDGVPPTAGRAVLSGHSQGSVLSVAAIASLHPDVASRVWLITHGSPLRRFYLQYFPRYFPESLLGHCMAKTQAGSAQGVSADASWVNFWRSTDPIGGRIYPGKSDEDPWSACRHRFASRSS